MKKRMNNSFNFKEKVAFITGGGSGIGRAAALAFGRAGASVVVADIGEQANQETARLIEEKGGRALAVRCDVTRRDEVKAALEQTADTFGRLDFAFNNAGIEPKNPARPPITTRKNGTASSTSTFVECSGACSTRFR
jgi:NAD(P)-dependent dehydrogenase (short-subunit alcohol dehydrogenase family)